MVKLDLGCGNRKTGSNDQFPFLGVDAIDYPGVVDLVTDLRVTPWAFKIPADGVPDYGEKIACSETWRFKEGSVDEVFSSHLIEHLTGEERVAFFNELYRVLKTGAKALIVTPDWSNACAYGDPTHKWPPVSSWYPLYLNKAWREANAPYVPYTCNFGWVHGVGWEPWLEVRNNDVKQFAIQHYINSARDLHITLEKQ